MGSAVVLGLLEGKLDASPSTAYFMTYRVGKCTANCGFCPQARESRSRSELLSRVSWPSFPIKEVLVGLEVAVGSGKVRRVCLQALSYGGVFDELVVLVKAIKGKVLVPVSVSCQPNDRMEIVLLHEAGVDRIGIALDA